VGTRWALRRSWGSLDRGALVELTKRAVKDPNSTVLILPEDLDSDARSASVHAVPWTRCTDARQGGCGGSRAEREFPSDKVYRRNDRGIVGVESLGPQGLAFLSTPVLDVAPVATVPRTYRAGAGPQTGHSSVPLGDDSDTETHASADDGHRHGRLPRSAVPRSG
jgi:hypothetical protein